MPARHCLPVELLRLFSLCFLVFFAAPGTVRGDELVTPDEAETGTLLLQSVVDGQYVPVLALATDVKIDISGPIARARVTQRFENTSKSWVEGLYVFPLPEDAAVDGLRLQIGDRFIEGQIKERETARREFETAKAQGRKASLIEQHRPNIFTNEVANIGPGETVVVQITYQQSVHQQDDVFSLRFPMVVAPRYDAGTDTDNAVASPVEIEIEASDNGSGWAGAVPQAPVLNPKQNPPVNPVSLTVSLDAGFPLADITSPFHAVTVTHDDADKAEITLAEGVTPANRDFELIWHPRQGQIPMAGLFRQDVEGVPYYLLMVTPPSSPISQPTPPREVTFILDISGSMSGESIRQAKRALLLAIDRLQPKDSFNVIAFNSDFSQLFPMPVEATAVLRAEAKDWVEALQASGGTEILPALKSALGMGHEATSSRLEQIILLTDGAIGNEKQLFETIAQDRGAARIFPIGIGSAPNSYFMSHAAELGQGSYTYIGAVDQVAERMTALFRKLETPVMTDIKVEWPDGIKVEAAPAMLPDLYDGETLVVAARADGNKGTVRLGGVQGEQPWRVTLRLENAAERAGVSKLWARRHIQDLERNRLLDARKREVLDQEILTTALAHHLVSRLTSLIAVDVTPSRPTDAPLHEEPVALNLPKGWDFGAVFGHDLAVSNQAQALPVELLKTRENVEADTDNSLERHKVTLPQTASPADFNILVGLLMLLSGGGLMLFVLTRRRRICLGS